mmetsp:Transcript_7900/g.26222  ORF Transcript_7900/g.26222 Transcript_7900/m.26222 type:complete len:202 (-) Transcript_7900:500-1105(-)
MPYVRMAASSKSGRSIPRAVGEPMAPSGVKALRTSPPSRRAPPLSRWRFLSPPSPVGLVAKSPFPPSRSSFASSAPACIAQSPTSCTAPTTPCRFPSRPNPRSPNRPPSLSLSLAVSSAPKSATAAPRATPACTAATAAAAPFNCSANAASSAGCMIGARAHPSTVGRRGTLLLGRFLVPPERWLAPPLLSRPFAKRCCKY